MKSAVRSDEQAMNRSTRRRLKAGEPFKKKAARHLAATAILATLAGGAGLLSAPAANAAGTDIQAPAPGVAVPSGDVGAATGQVYTAGPTSGWFGTAYQGSYWIKLGGQWVESWCGQLGAPMNNTGAWTEGAHDTSPEAAQAAAAAALRNGSPLDGSAVQYIFHEKVEKTTAPFFKNLSANEAAAAAARGEALWAAAAGHTGQYSVKPQLAITPPQSGDTETHGTVANTQVNTATGTVGAQVKLTLSAGAVFDATGTNVWTGAAGASPSWHATQTAKVVVTEDTQNLVAGWLRTATSAGVQSQYVAPGVTTVTGVSKDVQVTVSFQPQATSTAVTEVKAGGTLSDVLNVDAAPGSSWMAGKSATFAVDWYYSPTQVTQKNLSTIPAGATLFATDTGTASKPGDITVTADKKADKPGWYYPVASFTKAKQPAADQPVFTGDWKAKFNADGEETLEKFSPKVTTKASGVTDGKIQDTIVVTGNNPSATLSVVSKYYLTAKCTMTPGGTTTAPQDAMLQFTVTTTVKGNGTFQSAKIDAPWAEIIKSWGTNSKVCGYWQESIQAMATTNGWTGNHGIAAETNEYTKPTISTTASQNGTVPVTAHDTGVLTGTVPSGPGVVVQTQTALFKFGNDTTGSVQAVCLNALNTTPWQTVTAPGTITYPSTVLKDEGTYGYVETLKVSVTDKSGKVIETVLHTGKCGEKAETVIAFAPEKPVTPEKPLLPGAPQPAAPASVVTQPEVPTGHPHADPVVDVAGPVAAIGAGFIGLVTGGLVLARRRKTAAK